MPRQVKFRFGADSNVDPRHESWVDDLNERLRFRDMAFRACRSLLSDACFIEVDTPTFRPARVNHPVSSFHFLSEPDFEATLERAYHLKRLIFAPGIDRVFELRHRLRPDRPSYARLPEFTALELAFRSPTLSEAVDLITRLVKDLISSIALRTHEHGDLAQWSAADWPVQSATDLVPLWKTLPDPPDERRIRLFELLEEIEYKAAGLSLAECERRFLEDNIVVASPTYARYQKLPTQMELFFPPNLELLNLFVYGYSPTHLYVGCAIGFDRLLMLCTGRAIAGVVYEPWGGA